MGVSVDAKLVVGVRVDFSLSYTEEKETKYNENTGEPYDKEVRFATLFAHVGREPAVEIVRGRADALDVDGRIWKWFEDNGVDPEAYKVCEHAGLQAVSLDEDSCGLVGGTSLEYCVGLILAKTGEYDGLIKTIGEERVTGAKARVVERLRKTFFPEKIRYNPDLQFHLIQKYG